MVRGQVSQHMFWGYCLMCNKWDLWHVVQTCPPGSCRGSDIGQCTDGGMSYLAVRFQAGPHNIYCCLLQLSSVAFGVLQLAERERARKRERNQLGQRCQGEFRVLHEDPVRTSHSLRSCTQILPVPWKSIRQQLLIAVIFTASCSMKANVIELWRFTRGAVIQRLMAVCRPPPSHLIIPGSSQPGFYSQSFGNHFYL